MNTYRYLLVQTEDLLLRGEQQHRAQDGQARAGASRCSRSQVYQPGRGQQTHQEVGESTEKLVPAVPWCHDHLGMVKPIERYWNLT